MKRLITAVTLVALPLLVSLERGALTAAASSPPRAVPNFHSKLVCGIPAPRFAGCHAAVIADSTGTPEASTTPPSTAYGPTQLHVAYNLPCTPGGPVRAVCSVPTAYGGQTIAIVDANDDPTVESDLGVYSAQYGLPPCTVANGCFEKVDQNGGTAYPAVDGTWAFEISLDVQIAHMVCQTCKILLVEANSNSLNDLGAAENEAAALGATEISNSYGGTDGSWDASFDAAYNHAGVAITASTGDSGYLAEYPASASTVIAVGGTTLSLNADYTYASEAVWIFTGSGCSAYETANTWQTSLPNWGQTQCLAHRGAADVAADANPNTGAAIYDSTPYNSQTGWFQAGGTSLSAPLIASVIALAGGDAGVSNPQSVSYANFTSTNSHDITVGGNGSCGGMSICTAGPGYDGPTGLGSPNGTSGFVSNGSGTPPTPTSVPTSTSTPTATPTPKSTNTPTPTPTPTCTTRGGSHKCH